MKLTRTSKSNSSLSRFSDTNLLATLSPVSLDSSSSVSHLAFMPVVLPEVQPVAFEPRTNLSSEGVVGTVTADLDIVVSYVAFAWFWMASCNKRH